MRVATWIPYFPIDETATWGVNGPNGMTIRSSSHGNVRMKYVRSLEEIDETSRSS